MSQTAQNIVREVKKAVIGKDEMIEKVLLAMVAGGHILLEDRPGVGKTTLALAFSRAMALEYRRMQFTPDVMPADVIGFSMYQKQTGSFIYQQGAVMCNLFLADEINRTSSKTQSALLEAMEEGRVTVDGITHNLPKPFTVIATQNPAGSAGTQLLPESQLDRFLIRLSMGYPSWKEEVSILKAKQGRDPLDRVAPVADGAAVMKMHEEAESVYVADDVYVYMAKLAAATRAMKLVRTGISPRGTIALSRMSRAYAWYMGRDFVVPDDVKAIIFDTFEHRLVLDPKARFSDVTAHRVLESVLKNVPAPSIVKR